MTEEQCIAINYETPPSPSLESILCQRKEKGKREEKRKQRKQKETSVCFHLRKRRNAAHFQLINTADRAYWRKPHYAAGWWVGWAGQRRGWEELQNCYQDSVRGRELLRRHFKLPVPQCSDAADCPQPGYGLLQATRLPNG